MDAFARYQAQAAQLLRDPDDPAALVEQFALLAHGSDHSGAQLALAARAAALAPTTFEAVFNLGAAQMRAGCYRDALDTFRRSLALAGPRRAEAMHHAGMAHHDLGDFLKAIRWYDRAIALESEDRELRRSRAIALLSAGDLAQGLFDVEIEWHEPGPKPLVRSGLPRWRGEPLAGKSIIIGHEQGYGDTIQFCRVLPRIKAGRVIVSGPPELTELLADQPHADAWIDEDGPFEADAYASPISAAAALRLGYEDVNGEPYLTAEPLRLNARGRLKVGLVWRGSPGYRNDAVRSMRVSDLCPLFDLPRAAFYSLQVGEARREVSALGLDGFIADLTALIRDWRDTARAIMAMDVVVSVDTAVAHLAGALGKPVLLLLPFSCCWRWMRERDDTPWYRSARLFRQTVPNQWSDPVARVRAELERML